MITQEDKELLIKDLCARLPYSVKCCIYNFGDKTVRIKEDILYSIQADNVLTLKSYTERNEAYMYHQIKPYLFPMSSMTEEQQNEFDRTYANDMQVVSDNLKNRLDGQPYEINLGHYRHIDWLNKNHFDYRGLIEKGLALDATGLNIY